MSDYVQNPDYSMQLAAPEDDPGSYDWTRLQEEVDQAIPGPFADITLASLQEDTNVEAMDWSELNEALENGPWHDIFDWKRDGGAEMQPDHWVHHVDRNKIATLPAAMSELTGQMNDATVPKPEHVCTVHGCKSKPFGRRLDLNRHMLKHGQRRPFPCPAVDCRFVGKKAFAREDKLKEHILAGHDDDSIFVCSNKNCNRELTRDLLAVHNWAFWRLKKFRKCPMPRCGYKINLDRKPLDEMQIHLAEKHDVKGRSQVSNLLLSRGYDFAALDIVCPLCPSAHFKHHSGFRKHIIDCHVSNDGYDKKGYYCEVLDIDDLGLEYPFFPVETYEKTPAQDLRKHRRTILSLWPGFKDHDVWADIRDKH